MVPRLWLLLPTCPCEPQEQRNESNISGVTLPDPEGSLGLGGEDATPALSQVLPQIQPVASCTQDLQENKILEINPVKENINEANSSSAVGFPIDVDH
ncbi:hypothetical protein BTVI_138235 [Pitangus sulphuratus]|nr:hypothetical protein BTVI_138235 [Pitangus sulphuratus]